MVEPSRVDSYYIKSNSNYYLNRNIKNSGQSNNRRENYPQLDCLFVLRCNAIVKLAATCGHVSNLERSEYQIKLVTLKDNDSIQKRLIDWDLSLQEIWRGLYLKSQGLILCMSDEVADGPGLQQRSSYSGWI